MHGWFDELNGASPEVIAKIETVPYKSELFVQGDEEAKGDKAPDECCICMEKFSEKGVIKRTGCQHYFHEECLGKWLKTQVTCPLCRNDLEKEVLGDAAPSTSFSKSLRQSGH